jgi:ABC-2 type transport system permease protein
VARISFTGILPAVIVVILPATLTLALSLLGVTLNLQFPRFDWINSLQPVKQGLAAMLAMFGGMAGLGVLAGVYFALAIGGVSLEMYMLYCSAFFVLLSAVLYWYLVTKGCKRFDSF